MDCEYPARQILPGFFSADILNVLSENDLS